jgi:hypothetical protein
MKTIEMRKLTDIPLTIFTAHEEYKIIETREFWEIRLQRDREL